MGRGAAAQERGGNDAEGCDRATGGCDAGPERNQNSVYLGRWEVDEAFRAVHVRVAAEAAARRGCATNSRLADCWQTAGTGHTGQSACSAAALRPCAAYGRPLPITG